MRQQTSAYFQWAEGEGLFQHHVAWLTDDREVDVRARKNDLGVISLFIGVYDRNGMVIHEEYFEEFEVADVDDAMRWGVAQATAEALTDHSNPDS